MVEGDSLTVAGEVATRTAEVFQTGVEASAGEVSPGDVVDPQEVDSQETMAFPGTDVAEGVVHHEGCHVVLTLVDHPWIVPGIWIEDLAEIHLVEEAVRERAQS